MNTRRQLGLKWLPIALLVLGLSGGVVSAYAAANESFALSGIFAALTAAAAIGLTFIIAVRQASETETLTYTVTDVQATVDRLDGVVGKVNDAIVEIRDLQAQSIQILRKMAERESAIDYAPTSAETDDGSQAAGEAYPDFRDEAVAVLQSRIPGLEPETLIWRAKKPNPPIPGNHGWFVETPPGAKGGRWFVRKANGLSVRRAMPREYLDALETLGPLDLRSIKLDYQLNEHGLAAWYARTYDGELWRVWRANRSAEAGIQVACIENQADD